MSMGCLSMFCVFLNFFHQSFVVLIVEIIHFLCKVYSFEFYYILAIANGIYFLISFLTIWLLVYKKVTDLCIYVLVLYSETLLNLFFSSNSILVEPLGFSLYKIISSVNRNFDHILSCLNALYFFLLSYCSG
jgi:hypothetical protein